MGLLACLAVAYAAGCVSFASLVARLHGVDVRSVGSGNPGATNVARLLGKGWGRLVLVADILKGLLPVALLAPQPPLALPDWIVDHEARALLLVAAVVGHVYPVTARFAGGKGVATLIGGLLGFDWRLAACALVVHFAVRRLSGYVSLASVALAVSVPVLQLVGAGAGLAPARGLAATVGLALLVTLRHADNLGRIRAGTERRHGEREPLPHASGPEST